MEPEKQLVALLKRYIRLLKKERQALIKDDGETVAAIVTEKEAFLELLAKFEPMPSAAVIELVTEVKELQTTNLLLTEQALSYQATFLEAISQGVKQTNATYSRDGNLGVQTDSGLLNQSL